MPDRPGAACEPHTWIPYAGSAVALATRHGKQRVIARPLRAALALELRHAAAVDTDQLGTFSGEQPRPADALATCRLKAERGMQALGLDLGIASEGAFGPHPLVPLLPVGEEWMVFVDRRNDLVISERQLSRSTNYSSCTGADADSIAAWLQQVGFPAHGVMVRPHHGDGAAPAWLAKGVHDPLQLAAWIDQAARASELGLAWLETDMRAHCNPTRMAQIRRLAFRLARRVASLCPSCAAPGWGLLELLPGLPCAECGLATELARAELHGCGCCGHRREHPRRDQRRSADPQHCAYCNP